MHNINANTNLRTSDSFKIKTASSFQNGLETFLTFSTYLIFRVHDRPPCRFFAWRENSELLIGSVARSPRGESLRDDRVKRTGNDAREIARSLPGRANESLKGSDTYRNRIIGFAGGSLISDVVVAAGRSTETEAGVDRNGPGDKEKT